MSSERFAANLAALERCQPALAARVRAASAPSTTPARSGAPSCQLAFGKNIRWLHSAYDPVAEARRVAAELPAGATSVLLVGAGLGYLVAELLERPGLQVLLLEPELSFQRALFELFDVAAALDQGRLRIATADGSDIAALSSIERKAPVLYHPPLREPYADRLRHLRYLTAAGGARARCLVIDNKLFVADLVALLEDDAIAARVIHPRDVSLAGIQALSRSVQPAFLLSVNFSPELALLCSKLGVPYVSWTIDPLPRSRLRLLPGTDPARCLAFAHRRAAVAALQQFGLADAAYLPLAAPAGKRRVVEDDPRLDAFRCPVSFAGSSLSVEWNALFARVRQLGCDNDVERRLATWLHEHFEARARDCSYYGLAEDGGETPDWLLAALPEAQPVELADRINGALSHLLRRARVRAAAGSGIHVYGDDGWESCGALYRGRAEHGEGLTLLYNASLANLDVPRIYQRDVVSMRVFDVMLCGGLLLAEPAAELLELFADGVHLFTYRDDASLAARIAEVGRDRDTARTVAAAARREVERAHLMRHRLDVILSAVRARGWLPGG